MAVTIAPDAVDELTAKVDALAAQVDALAAQVDFLASWAREQEMRRREWEELRTDLSPVITEAYRLAVDQLAEVEDYVQADDVLRLVKRLARNTRNLEKLLVQLESLSEFVGDAAPLAGDAFAGLLERLDGLERRGYFEFARSGLGVLDEVVTSFTEDDVRQLGENIVLILETVKEMTQPEVMLMLRRTMHTVRESEELNGDVSMFRLLRQMRDPEVKRGLARMLAMLRSMGEAPARLPGHTQPPTPRRAEE